MDKEIMLGRIIMVLVTVPAEMLGALADLVGKLVSKDGREWFVALKKFLRKEDVWAKQVVTGIVNLDTNPVAPNGCSWHAEDQLLGRLRGKVMLERRGDDLYVGGRKMDLFLAEAQKTGRIGGRQLKEILKTQPVIGSNVLDYMLAHPELIPDAWKGKAIFFWGDIFRRSDGSLYVRYLDWHGGRWHWYDGWLGNDWRSRNPALVCAE